MKSVGGIISSYVIGVSISKLGPRSVFFENVPIALMTTLSGCLVVEKRLLSPRSHRKTERDDIENPDGNLFASSQNDMLFRTDRELCRPNDELSI